MFVPWLWSSQPCEKLFRSTRSMTTTYSTVVNYSILDIIHRLNRIQVLQNITVDLQDKIHFPREKSSRLGSSAINGNPNFENLSDHELDDVVGKSFREASALANSLGMTTPLDMNEYPSIFPLNDVQIESEEDTFLDENIIYGDNDDLIQDDTFLNTDSSEAESDMTAISEKLISGGELNLKDFSNKTDSFQNEKGQFLKIRTPSGAALTIKKKSLVWFLSDKRYRISADRILRVRDARPTTNRRSQVKTT
jgi:hypothetical protein